MELTNKAVFLERALTTAGATPSFLGISLESAAVVLRTLNMRPKDLRMRCAWHTRRQVFQPCGYLGGNRLEITVDTNVCLDLAIERVNSALLITGKSFVRILVD